MGTAKKIAIGVGLAGGALLAAYLLTGNRKEKTKGFLVKAGKKIKNSVVRNTTKATNQAGAEQDAYYI